MQLALHDMTGQSWVSHVGSFFEGGRVWWLLPLGPPFFGGEERQCDQSITKLIDI